MKTELNVKDRLLTFERNWFNGTFQYTIEDETKVLQSAYDPRTHIWFTLKRNYKIEMDSHILEIEHRRPLLISFAKPHTFIFRLDGEVVSTITQ